jgi:glycosyltransferase involved in cell wall biosynthesis
VFSSTVIPTVGRSTLARSVESVLRQTVGRDQFEVVVVNDSDGPLVAAEWQQSKSVRIVHTRRRERSVARNTGAALARGRYLHFLDDDDWLAPDAFEHLWELARSRAAGWVYGHSQLVDRQGQAILRLRHALSGNCFVQAMAGEWVPLQASLIDADTFFAVGGFNPLVSGPEDVDLLRRVSLQSDLAVTPNVVACISWGAEHSTTDYRRHPEQSRLAREQILDRTGVLRRMRASAGSSYWRGRIVRAYATSLVWNVRRKHLMTAASRGVFSLVALLSAGLDVFSPDFWRAVSRPHASEVFNQGLREAGRLAPPLSRP